MNQFVRADELQSPPRSHARREKIAKPDRVSDQQRRGDEQDDHDGEDEEDVDHLGRPSAALWAVFLP